MRFSYFIFCYLLNEKCYGNFSKVKNYFMMRILIKAILLINITRAGEATTHI